jgi:hypothetical protein
VGSGAGGRLFCGIIGLGPIKLGSTELRHWNCTWRTTGMINYLTRRQTASMRILVSGLPGKLRDSVSIYAKKASFHIPSHSFFPLILHHSTVHNLSYWEISYLNINTINKPKRHMEELTGYGDFFIKQLGCLLVKLR